MSDQEDNKPVTIKSLKKEFDLFKQEVLARLPDLPLAPVHSVRPNINPEDVAVPKEAASESITFHFVDRFAKPRTFSEQENGAEWRELAQQFHDSNQDKIKKRDDK
jgi:hypothetical protein